MRVRSSIGVKEKDETHIGKWRRDDIRRKMTILSLKPHSSYKRFFFKEKTEKKIIELYKIKYSKQEHRE